MDVIYQISRAQKYHRRSKRTVNSGISVGRFLHRTKALVDLGVNYVGRTRDCLHQLRIRGAD